MGPQPSAPPTDKLHVEIVGEGPPVILLHSSGLSGRQWRRLTASLSQNGFRVIVPDLHGHGESAAWPETQAFSYAQDVAAVVALMRAEGPLHVVGHSYGGLLALLAGIEASDMVRSMTVFDPVAFGVLDPRKDAAAIAEVRSVLSPWGTSVEEHEKWLQAFVDYWGGVGAWLALSEDVRAEFRRVGWPLQQGVRTLSSDTTPASAFADLTYPFTLMTGERSPKAAQSVIERLGSAIQGSRVIEVKGAGHMGPLSHSEKVNAHVLEAVSVR